jgi:hypothetical protein
MPRISPHVGKRISTAAAIFSGKSPTTILVYIVEKGTTIAGVSLPVAPQRTVGTALPVDVLNRSLDLKAAISGRTSFVEIHLHFLWMWG